MSWVERIKGWMASGKSEAALEASLPPAPAEEKSAGENAGESWLEVRIDPPAPEAVTCPIRFDRVVSPGGTSLFETPDEARAWPAVHALLGIQGVHSIIGKGDVLVVARHGGSAWPEILAAIEPALREAFAEKGKVQVAQPAAPTASPTASPTPSPAPSPTPAASDPADAGLRSRVARVIEEQINPAVASHGGYIDLLDVQGSRVFIHMGGGCQGCAMSSATLKHGVETTLRAEIPEITEILDTTDHASGANPFFAS